MNSITHPMAASAEAAVVVRGAQLGSSPESLGRLETLVDESLDWQRVLRIARANGVGPLLHHTLSERAVDGVPKWVRDDLREERRVNASSNLYRTNELLDILDRFDRQGIRALPFKGPVLAARAYGDDSLRTYADLDIVTSRETFSAAVDVLQSAGFEWVKDAPRRDDAAVLGGPFTAPLCDEYQLRRERDDLLVELRWRIGTKAQPFGIEFDALWDRRCSVSITGRSVPALGDEDRALVLASHGVRHYWERLAWISDMAALVQNRREIRWPVVIERARRAGIERQLLVGLELAAALRDEPLPAAKARDDPDGRIESLVEEVCRAFRTNPIRDVSGANQVDRAYYSLRASDTIPDALIAAYYTVPIHPDCVDYETHPLPRWLFPVYYLSASARVLSRWPAIARLLSRLVR